MKYLTLHIISVFLLLCLSACNTTDSNGGIETPPSSNGEDPTVTYTLNVDLSDAGAGSVTPSSGEFEEGDQVTVEANANEGWDFVNWSGDLQSEENPFSFTIENDVNLMANFIDQRSDYSVLLTLSDSEDELLLEFGQQNQEMFEYAPPSPPSGALHGYLDRNSEQFFVNYQQDTLREVIWELHFQVGSGNTLNLEWELQVEKMEGTLILKDPNQTFEIDMSGESIFNFSVGDYNFLIIEYQFE
jgi:hypothetical protein